MSNPPLSFTVQSGDAHRVFLEIEGPDGVWQLPIPRAQANTLGHQLVVFTETVPSTDAQTDLQRFVDNAMIAMPKGRLWMGAMPGNDVPTDATPRHAVDVAAFEMAMIPITQGVWFHVMGTNPSQDTGVRKPVTHVSWMEAVLFCNRLSDRLGLPPAYEIQDGVVDRIPDSRGFRLPTEAEWEYAARTHDDLHFSGSDKIDRVGWVAEHRLETLPEVGQKEPNLWGFHDLSGLVMEWCWDLYGPYLSTDHKETTPTNRVCRGGSWQHEARFAHCTARASQLPNFKGQVGIRVVRSCIMEGRITR